MHAITHNPLTLLILQMTVVVALSRLLGALLRRIGQPMVIAEITAGILLGPSLLGLVAPGVMDAVFPKSSMPVLGMLSQVGLVLFMFLIGLELDPKLLKNRGRASVVISHTSIVIPFALGALASSWLRSRLSEPDVPFTSFALFMGVAMSITAFPVLARILAERRLLRTKVGALAITCAAVDDVTAWCLLAFVVSTVRSTGLDGAVRTTVMALGYIAVMLFVVRPFLARLGARVGSGQHVNQGVVAISLLLLLVSSMVTEAIGIHALFGAFVLGAAIPKDGGLAEALAHKLEDLVVVLLLPLFFAYSGLRTQIGLLSSPHHWGICALLILLACLGKFGGSALAARFTGLGWRESSAIGILMNTRGLMELVALNLGLDLGVISPTLFTMMVLMALFTTFITTPLLQRIYPFELFAKEVADTPEATPVPVNQAPPFTVVMCVADDRTGPGMVTLGHALGGPAAAERLYALHLIHPDDRASFVLRQERGDTSSDGDALEPLLSRATSLSVPVKPLSFVSGEPAVDICRVAEAKHADLLLLGWRKPLIGKAALSGTVYEVMKRAPADVAVLVDRGLTQIRRVLVPFLGSAHDRAALRLAQRITHIAGADVTVLHVVAKGRDGGKPLGAKARVEEVFQEPGAAGQVKFEVVEHDVPSEAALAEAARGYDLVIVGAGAEWGLSERLFGLQAERMIHACPISLLVVHQHGEVRAAAPKPSLATIVRATGEQASS
ncbi:cation:proton antiporter domain-containing protein [Polyangium jinanense]|uniref:Cation:proton antiporter n=1 Tax=Polyangium jinanense TaxID=2829994 RepID=A0A9X4ATU6_9BACT|nr:cation:proton antiporter [Polyangium jinanense]MDC3957610.1 cation:proton antiporter [Polyangium jinanense]MDC3984608.1 cation:proton antiporter [Polyangium jinanense]